MASWRTSLILADLLKIVERVDTVDGRHTVICKPGDYEEIVASLEELNRWKDNAATYSPPVSIAGVFFKPSERQ
jgi:hypothetical protein